MDRTAKDKETEVDPTKPVIMPALKEDDCFGREWDMQSNECSICADHIFCGICYAELTLKSKVAQITKDKGGFLDETDFGAIDNRAAFDFIKSGKTNVKDFIAYITKLSKCIDEVAVIEWIKRFFKASNLYTKDGIIWYR